MKLYTKRGDAGETDLFGAGRVPKDVPRVEAYGTVDELNACLGVAMTEFRAGRDHDLIAPLTWVQAQLFVVGGDLAAPDSASVPRTPDDLPAHLEAHIDQLEGELPELRAFILPGGGRAGAQLHVARTVCRRAERMAVTLAAIERTNPAIITFLNRLSDLLFVMARVANHREGIPESEWHAELPAGSQA